jgi:hypothetical protein
MYVRSTARPILKEKRAHQEVALFPYGTFFLLGSRIPLLMTRSNRTSKFGVPVLIGLICSSKLTGGASRNLS